VARKNDFLVLDAEQEFERGVEAEQMTARATGLSEDAAEDAATERLFDAAADVAEQYHASKVRSKFESLTGILSRQNSAKIREGRDVPSPHGISLSRTELSALFMAVPVDTCLPETHMRAAIAHPQVARILLTYASLLHEQHSPREAAPLEKRAKKIMEAFNRKEPGLGTVDVSTLKRQR
jgi:hypothetical protein